MYKVKISTGHQGKFPTQAEAQAWLQKHLDNNTFGKPDRWLQEQAFTGLESIETSEETREVESLDEEVITEYFFSANFTHEITDISAEFEAEQVFVNRKKEYGDIGAQMDEIFHDMDAWKARIQAIKLKYPKI